MPILGNYDTELYLMICHTKAQTKYLIEWLAKRHMPTWGDDFELWIEFDLEAADELKKYREEFAKKHDVNESSIIYIFLGTATSILSDFISPKELYDLIYNLLKYDTVVFKISKYPHTDLSSVRDLLKNTCSNRIKWEDESNNPIKPNEILFSIANW